jgi:hypothetical protein
MARQRGRITGQVMLDRRESPRPGGVPFELLSIHFDDGGSAMTIHHVAERLGIALKTGDRLTITLSKTQAKAKRR